VQSYLLNVGTFWFTINDAAAADYTAEPGDSGATIGDGHVFLGIHSNTGPGGEILSKSARMDDFGAVPTF